VSYFTLRRLSKKCKVANKQAHEAKPMSLAKTRTRPSVRVWGTKGGVSGTLIWLGEPKKLRGLHLGNSIGAPKVPHGTSCSLLLDTTRRRRLSSITRAPCRRVMGVPGPAFAGGAVGSERNLVVLDARDMLHDAFAVRGPGIGAEGEVSSQ
jgi:hypothetical protein